MKKSDVNLSNSYSRGGNKVIDSEEGLTELINLVEERGEAFIGLHASHSSSQDNILLNPERERKARIYISDVSSIQPEVLAIALPRSDRKSLPLVQRSIDLRKLVCISGLNRLFSLPTVFAGYNLKPFLHCIWRLGVSEPSSIWDSYIFERARLLGTFNQRYYTTESDGKFADSKARERAALEERDGLSFPSICLEYGANLSCFVGEEPGSWDTSQASSVASALAELYPLQIERAGTEGILNYCQTVEMPWVITNASVEWVGVKVDYGKARAVVDKIQPVADDLLAQLSSDYGLSNPRSGKELQAFFRREGLLDKFLNNRKPTFDRGMLKANESLHPAIPVIRRTRRLLDLLTNRILQPHICGKDGRVHADHIQLGTDTGRQTCRYPNIAGMDQSLKPVIVPAEGYGIGEVDYSQIEPGITGSFYGEGSLVDLYNSGDIYSSMAKIFAHDSLSKEDLALGWVDFKAKHKNLRSQMKILTLGIVYGMTPYGVAANMKCSYTEAKESLCRFKAMFPALEKAIAEQHRLRRTTSSVAMICGLRRHKGKPTGRQVHGSKPLISWEKRWFVNAPVQGSATIVFKAAGNQLYEQYKHYGARLILTVHDSFVFEAPLDKLDDVADLTEKVMCETLRSFFPDLKPLADKNILHPYCWNKDGCLGFEVEADGTLVEMIE